MTPLLKIRPATPDDLEAILMLRLEAGDWLRERGTDQWQDPPRSAWVESIADGNAWLGVDGGQVVATITVDEYADPELWTAGDRPRDALYVHRMIVARQAAGRELGSALLAHAEHLAAEAGKRLLRLDAWSSNTDLHRYYLDRGWTHVRTLELPHRGSGALFEREVASI
jgi:GNAT superfamily N-acetyltransferase